ncbi:MAG: DNA polymerase III subunit gamma/tau [Eubacteriales bacterium]|nr:DNA polymerase III subunit gamma/tau [Eubacteriales bacterium]
MHQALYRKWRPATFDDVYGQEHITNILRYEAENGKFNHAYLFCGSRGTGKTTCAKILAKVINCEHPENGNPCGKCKACQAIEAGSATDVIEMDAASNNGVDNIRDIKDAVNFAPASLKYRVYIIDEVHMLSNSAFNALLKTLEEPPEYVVFILATTELQKLPATIISRCQRFDFRRISTENLCKRLEIIAENEKIDIDPKALMIIARNSMGGMRDAISLLELCSGFHKRITPELVSETIGASGRGQLIDVVNAVFDKDYDKIFSYVDEVVSSSKDIAVFWQELISLYRDLLVVKTNPDGARRYLDLTDEELNGLSSLSARATRETLLYHCSLLDDALYSMLRSNAVKRIIAEMTLIKMSDEALSDTTSALLSRISKLEAALASGAYATPAVAGVTADEPGIVTASGNDAHDADEKKQPVVSKTSEAVNGSAPEKHSDSKAGNSNNENIVGDKKPQEYRMWTDVVERIAMDSPMIAGIVKTGSAFVSDVSNRRVFIIQFDDNGFQSSMIETFGGKKAIRSALCLVEGREVPESDIIIRYVKPGTDRRDVVIDEILHGIE